MLIFFLILLNSICEYIHIFINQSKKEQNMSKLLKTAVVCASVAMVGAPGMAESYFPNGIQFGVGVSASSGVNGFVGYANKSLDSFWLKRLGLRLDFASSSPIRAKVNSGINDIMGEDGIEIGDELTVQNGGLSARHFAALVDIYPFGDTWFLGGLRLTGGYVFGRLHLGADVKSKELPTGEFEFELDDIQYKYVGGTMNGKAIADWKYRGPYVGTGFDLGLFWGFKIFLDAGVVFTNKAAQLGLDVPTTGLYQWYNGEWTAVAGTNSLQQQLQAVLDNAKKNVIRDGQEELNKYKFYPMVKLGLMYRF